MIERIINKACGFFSMKDDNGQDPYIYDHPVEAIYNNEKWHDINLLSEWNLNNSVSAAGFGFGKENWHPFKECILESINHDIDEYRGSVLDTFYKQFIPDNMFSAMMPNKEFIYTKKAPPYCYVFPWEPRDINSKIKDLKTSVESENERHGFDHLDIEDGFPYHGPVTKSKGKLEYQRLMNLHKSVNKNGYIRSNTPSGDIRGTLLHRDGEYIFLVRAGVHRAGVLSACHNPKVPVRLITPFVVSLSQLEHWPQVVSGLWPKHLAEAYFNHLFDFECREWACERGLLTDI